MFRHYRVIFRELVINTLLSYTSISNTVIQLQLRYSTWVLWKFAYYSCLNLNIIKSIISSTTIIWELALNLVLQMQPHVISLYGVTSRIRYMFLLFPQVSRNWGQLAYEVGDMVSHTHRPPLLPHDISLIFSSVKVWVDPRTTEGLSQCKILVTSSGIEP